MEDNPETSKIENQTIGDEVQNIIHWMNLADLPTAKDLDPEGKLGLEGAFRNVDGIYPDPIPSSIIDQAIKEVNLSGGYKPIEIPILAPTTLREGTKIIPKHGSKLIPKHLPLFKEQVNSVAQYLVKQGFKTPKPTPTRGEDFVLIGGVAEVSKFQYFDLNNPHLIVGFERSSPKESAPVENVHLTVVPTK